MPLEKRKGMLQDIEELLYTQRLADVDNGVRMKALRRLKTFLETKSSQKGFTYEELIKIWKGLYYCMYMADKLLVQEDLADDISNLIHNVSTHSQKLLFFKAAMNTFAREWHGIDNFRMNKFIMLITRVLRQCLIFLSRINWAKEEVNSACEILESSVIVPFDETNSKPLGLKMHVADVILEELAKVGRKFLPDAALISFIYPFIKALALSNQVILRDAIQSKIIDELRTQTEMALKIQDHLTSQNIHSKKGKDAATKMGETEEEQEEFVMDPKAGGVDVYIPPLKPDCGAVSLAFTTVAKIRGISKYNKDVLFKYAQMFEDLAEENDASNASNKRGVKRKMNTDDHQPYKRRRRHRKFKRKTPKPPKPEIKKRFKNLHKAQIRIKSQLSNVGDQLWTSIEKKTQQTPKPTVDNAGGSDKIKASPGFKRDNPSDVLKNPLKQTTLAKGRTVHTQGGWEVKKIISKSTESNKVIKGRKRKPKTIGPSKSQKVAVEEKPLMQVQPEPTKQKTKIGALKSESSDTLKSPSGLIKGKGKNRVKKDKLKKGISGSSHDLGVDTKSKEASVVRENTTLPPQNDQRLPSPSENKTSPMVNGGRKRSRRKKKANKSTPVADGQEKSGGKVDPWDEPLKEGETEIVIRSKKFAKKMKLPSKHRQLVIKNPKVNTKGRTLKINLRRNEEHDIKDYNKVLKSSPGIPYSAHKKPLSSVLKSCK